MKLAVSRRYHHADANSAICLTAAQFEVDPYGIDPNVQNDGAEKHFATLRADLNVALSDKASLAGDVRLWHLAGFHPLVLAFEDAHLTPVDRWTLGAYWRRVGAYEVNATNTAEAPAYDLVDNVTDETYATSVSIIGGQTLLAPGAPRAVPAGVQVSL